MRTVARARASIFAKRSARVAAGMPPAGAPPLLARALVAVLVVLVGIAALAATARADGDPASDYLLEQQVFLGSDSTHALTSADHLLEQTVKVANAQGYRIRVAVIASQYDLGAVTQVWGRPRTYARFLGIELSLAYRGRLLVVMPDGFGFYWRGHFTTAPYRTLSAIAIGRGGAATLDAAALAVRRLAGKAGVSTISPILQPRSTGGRAGAVVSSARARPRSSGFSLAVAIAAAALLAIAVATAIASALRERLRPVARDRLTLAEGSRSRLKAVRGGLSRRRRRARNVRWRWVLRGVAAIALAGAATSAFVLSSGTSPVRSAKQLEAGAAQAQLLWKRHQRLAPNFHLHDENGAPVSLAAYRGKPVIVTFIDPTCRHLCPLEAHVLNELDSRLPASARPAILAVSVDIYSDSRANLMRDFRRWHLVPQWHWAIGRPAALNRVWKRYYATVDVTTKKIAGVTVHYVTHSEMAYVIDSEGYERSLLQWPFNPSEVEGILHELSHPNASAGQPGIASGKGEQQGESIPSTAAGDAGAESTPLPTAKPPAPPGGAAAVTTKSAIELGSVLAAGPKKLTVYMFSGDRGGQSTCYGECAALWEPVLTSGPPTAGAGVRSSELSTTKRVDGQLQVTYAGHPLYHYLPDVLPSDAIGEGLSNFGGQWYAVAPTGRPVKSG